MLELELNLKPVFEREEKSSSEECVMGLAELAVGVKIHVVH